MCIITDKKQSHQIFTFKNARPLLSTNENEVNLPCVHVGPVNPSGQIQWKRFCPNSEHYPPFLQGLLKQGRDFNAVESRKKGQKITLRCNNWD